MSQPTGTLTEHSGHDHQVYVCPMHPQVMSEEPGKCPICGMDLVVKQPAEEEIVPAQTADQEHGSTTYVCPMHPQVMSEEPGKCPICGMDLVEKKSQGGMPHSHSHDTSHAHMQMESVPTITVPTAVVNQLGVRTAPVVRGTLQRQVEGFGIFVRSTVQGYRSSYHGSPAKANDPSISTSALLVQGQVFERQAPLLHIGQTVKVHVPGMGSKEWEGKLIGLESQVNQTTHTQVFHVSVAPDAASVPPGMNANLLVEVEPIRNALLVPREAVIVTGKGARVIVALGDGRFQQRRVDAEDFGEEQIVVRSGLQDGERVVTSAQFLLDSEANLQAGLQRLTGDAAQTEALSKESGQ